MQLPMSLQVQDGNIVVGSAYTLIEGLSQDARVTRSDEDGLVLGFELQEGLKSMVDIALGKVFSSADHIPQSNFADVYLRTTSSLVAHSSGHPQLLLCMKLMLTELLT